jgi:hypothetical protein
MRFASPFHPFFLLLATSCHSFNSARFVRCHFSSVRVFQSATDPEINGDDGAGRSGIVRMEDTKSQLFAAFTALGEGDQYDAVLTGLCAKFLETATPNPESQDALQDPLDLLQEMNRRRIQASPRSMMALIDVRILLVPVSRRALQREQSVLLRLMFVISTNCLFLGTVGCPDSERSSNGEGPGPV